MHLRLLDCKFHIFFKVGDLTSELVEDLVHLIAWKGHLVNELETSWAWRYVIE